MNSAFPRIGLLYPQQNQLRNVQDISGVWQFQLDPQEEGEAKGWFRTLPTPRPIAVPCSWNDLLPIGAWIDPAITLLASAVAHARVP